MAERIVAGLVAWAAVAAIVRGLVALLELHRVLEQSPAVLTAAGCALVGCVLLLRAERRRQARRALERHSGAPRRLRRAAHNSGGRAVWRATRGRIG